VLENSVSNYPLVFVFTRGYCTNPLTVPHDARILLRTKFVIDRLIKKFVKIEINYCVNESMFHEVGNKFISKTWVQSDIALVTNNGEYGCWIKPAECQKSGLELIAIETANQFKPIQFCFYKPIRYTPTPNGRLNRFGQFSAKW